MNINLNQALIYYFKDNKLLIKIIPIYIIFFAQIFIPVISLVLLPFVFGYITLNTNSRIFYSGDNSLDDWKNLKEIYTIGIESITYLITPLLIVSGLIIIISDLFKQHTVIPSFQIVNVLDAVSTQLMLIFLPILIIIYFAFYLPSFLLYVVNLGNSLQNESQNKPFSLKDIRTKDYLNVVWYHFLFSVLLLAITIPTNYMVAIVLAPFIILILTDINAQFLRKTFNINNELSF